MVKPKTAVDLKLSSKAMSDMGTAIVCDNHFQITVGNITHPMTVNWL